MIIYQKTFSLCREKRISSYDLVHRYGFSSSVLSNMKRNGYVRTTTLDRFSQVLHCSPLDLFEEVSTYEVS